MGEPETRKVSHDEMLDKIGEDMDVFTSTMLETMKDGDSFILLNEDGSLDVFSDGAR